MSGLSADPGRIPPSGLHGLSFQHLLAFVSRGAFILDPQLNPPCDLNTFTGAFMLIWPLVCVHISCVMLGS